MKKMNLMRILSIVCACGLTAASSDVFADEIFRADSTVSGVTVCRLTDTEITLSDGKKIAAANVNKIVFTRRTMPAGTVRLLLADGSELSGVLRGREKGKYLFRSAAFGLLQIPVRQVSAVVFTPGFSLREQKLDGGKPHLLFLKNAPGKPLAGRLIAIGAETFDFSMAQVILRIHINSPDAVLFSERLADENAARLVLRNGDRIAGKIQCAGDRMTVGFPGAETPKAVPLGAIAEIQLTTNHTTGEKP